MFVYRSSERGFLGTQDYAVYQNSKNPQKKFRAGGARMS
nr:MAG TPA: hypothetical protein [Caudoviricetes sp.]